MSSSACEPGVGGEGALLQGAFAVVPVEASATSASSLQQRALQAALPGVRSLAASESFYLALARSELGQRWFLSAYLSQLFPRVSPGADSLGTRVVTFRVQNGRLFVLDADDRKHSSAVADPQVIVEAYPLVTQWPGNSSPPNAADYVLFDPSAGLNRFGVVSDSFSSSDSADRFQVDLAFAQNAQVLQDGIRFEQVFTGAGEAPQSWRVGVEPSPYRVSGTLGIALRRYQEGQGFVPTTLPTQEHYFRSEPKLVNGWEVQTAAKWNLGQGRPPIEWLISHEVLELARRPEYAPFDFVGAIRAGVESWNQAFGFEALRARVAAPSDAPSDDEKNFLIVDPAKQFGFAFANWRTNPNTGEIRGASVYFNASWFDVALGSFPADAPGSSSLSGRTARVVPSGDSVSAPSVHRTPHDEALRGDGAQGPDVERSASAAPAWPVDGRLTWGSFGGQRLCARHVGEHGERWEGSALGEREASGGGDVSLAASSLTRKQKVERFITHVVLHEIGHTLGLRHNFRGSLAPPTSSAMDYVDGLDSVESVAPGPYDVDAIRYLYRLSPQLPSQPFCTDEGTREDPLCAAYDRTGDPLAGDVGRAYERFARAYVEGVAPSAPNQSLNGVLAFVRSGGDGATRLRAWRLASAGLLPGGTAGTPGGARGALPERVDALSRTLLARLYLDPPEVRGRFRADPTDTAVAGEVTSAAAAILRNADGLRSFETRRLCVDVLAKLQSSAAFEALAQAREAIASAPVPVNGRDALLTENLLRRIDAALRPYFH